MNADIIKAVRDKLGEAEDNFYRASVAFRGLSHEEMAKEYGESGERRQDILDGYRSNVERWKRALEECQ